MKKHKAEYNKDHGFKVPEDYFGSFDEKLWSRLSEKELPENSGFKVPESYFETVEDQVMSRLSNETKVLRFKPNPKLYYITGVAASLLLLLAIFTNQSSEVGISTEMVESYFEHSGLDSYELADLLYEADLLEEDFVISEIGVNEENIETYLLEHSDIEQLLQ